MSFNFEPTLSQKLGCWAHERWRTELVLRAPKFSRRMGMQWQDLCNRHESIEKDVKTGARICLWEGSSSLTVNNVFPQVGQRLLHHCLQEWPVQFNLTNEAKICSDEPEISVIVPIGGEERLPLFWMTLAALRAQRGVRFQIIVVEQSDTSILEGKLPPDVMYVSILKSYESSQFNKSRALNLGASHSRAPYILILDADYLLPQDFLREVLIGLRGRDVIRPARYIFYLDKKTTRSILSRKRMSPVADLESIVQNNPTPIAVNANTYWRIGGHDEQYFGWGGEDDEFLDRLRLGDVLEGGWLPVIHLWHPPAPQRADGSRNSETHRAKMRIPATKRVRLLKQETLLRRNSAGL